MSTQHKLEAVSPHFSPKEVWVVSLSLQTQFPGPTFPSQGLEKDQKERPLWSCFLFPSKGPTLLKILRPASCHSWRHEESSWSYLRGSKYQTELRFRKGSVMGRSHESELVSCCGESGRVMAPGHRLDKLRVELNCSLHRWSSSTCSMLPCAPLHAPSAPSWRTTRQRRASSCPRSCRNLCRQVRPSLAYPPLLLCLHISE